MKSKVFKIVIIAICCIVMAMIGLFSLIFILNRSVSIPVNNNYTVSTKPAIKYPLNSFNYENISTDTNNLKYYLENGNITSSMGVDVSYFQGDIDWQKVKASGIDFAIIRVGYRGRETGLINLDENFHKNIKSASEAGIKLGVYFFSQAINIYEAKEEADYVINQIKDYSLDYPVIFDWESAETNDARTLHIDEDTITDLCVAFCDTIINYGYKPMIYSNRELTANLLDLEKLADYPFWYAEYTDLPSLHHNFTIWQYTHEGIIDGIPTRVDLNISFHNYSDIHSPNDNNSSLDSNSINDIESIISTDIESDIQ